MEQFQGASYIAPIVGKMKQEDPKPAGKGMHRRQGSFTQFVDCAVDRTGLPEAEELLKRRDGSVLAQHTILKADHFYRGIVDDLGIRLLGAPNFRKTDLNIYGVAQPSLSGLYTLLTMLGCGPLNPEGQNCTWFNTREEPLIFLNDQPFVLRDQSAPASNIKAYAGISRERLEMMEERLKEDVEREASDNGGILLVHDELGDGRVVPCFVGCERVQTSREVFQEDLLAAGYRVAYHRIPMSHGLSPLDPFIDDYIEVFKRIPLGDTVVFSCGLGIGRTTFGMLVGLLIRRALTLMQNPNVEPLHGGHRSGTRQDVLRLVLVLEKALGQSNGSNHQNQSAIQWVLSRDQILENLLAALSGNYKIILDLVRVLEEGVQCKRVVDAAVDRCADMLNLRESILIGRVRHSLHMPEALDTALAFLERYFTLIALSGYLNEAHSMCFSQWIQERPEIWNMFKGLRRAAHKPKVFLPITKLTGLAPAGSRTKEEQEAQEAERNVLKNRAGSVLVPHTILKIDSWASERANESYNLRKASGGVPVWAVAQPRLPALRSILAQIRADSPDGRICWICVREEPLVYIHDEPYVLRDIFASLRNLRSYSGIPAERLEQLEVRLKEDVLGEASLYNSQVLLHAEDSEGVVYPVWEGISGADSGEVRTMAQAMSEMARDVPGLEYHRIPVTAEDAPEPADFDAILRIIQEASAAGPVTVVFNCQIGAGRSTTGQVIAGQVLAWLRHQSISGPSPSEGSTSDTVHFKAVHSILRVIRYGLESKHALDSLVDATAAVLNLRLAPSQWAEKAEHASDPVEARKAKRKGLLALKRYCLLLLFQAYLNDNPLNDMGMSETFEQYIVRHPEFIKLLKELASGHGSLETLTPDSVPAGAAEGHALTNEVAFVIGNRQGSVLGPMTILKYDHFPGCQKLSLPERIEGAPNFREVPLPSGLSVYGMAMPMAQAIQDVLVRMRASTERNVLWISLREEPVLFVSGRPFVLRVVKDPVSNIEMTGIVSERVESMEDRLKGDALTEIQVFGEKLLLHEEELLPKGGFELLPVWERTVPQDLATPAEVYSEIGAHGFRLCYVRIPITDEQAPIPIVFDQLFQLIWNRPAGTDLMFNCQMGRGRTTTGMVIATLIHLVQKGVAVQPSTTGPSASPSASLLSADSSSLAAASQEAFTKRFLSGEYKLILHLISVLEHGKAAKRYTDFSIDLCSHIQNLREAIFNFKLRIEAPHGEGSNPAVKEMGMNYLIRYFYLIVFGEFVQQRVVAKGVEAPAGEHEFSVWLQERREITNLVAKPKSLDFS